jgi:class 3 adenylate cyclase
LDPIRLLSRSGVAKARPAMKRRIAAVLAADIVGYSRLSSDDEEETVRRLTICRKVFDETTAQNRGRVVNMVGDAVLAEFPNAVDAIRCAIHTQEVIRVGNLDFPSNQAMSVRIGITVGDIIDKDGQLFGDTVNIAARLESLCAPGGICASRIVYEHVMNEVSAQFEDIGELYVKNIQTPVHAYMIAPYRGAREGSGGSASKDTARLQRLTIGAAILLAVAASFATALSLYRSSR